MKIKRIFYEAFIVSESFAKDVFGMEMAMALERNHAMSVYPDYDKYFVDMVSDGEWLSSENFFKREGISSALREVNSGKRKNVTLGIPDFQSLALHETLVAGVCASLRANGIVLEVAGQQRDIDDDLWLDVYKTYSERLADDYEASLNPVERATILRVENNNMPVVELSSEMGVTGEKGCLLTDLLEQGMKTNGIWISTKDGTLDVWDSIACEFLLWLINEKARRDAEKD